MEQPLKTCIRCGVPKPADAQHFHKRRSALRAECKTCRNSRDPRKKGNQTATAPASFVVPAPAPFLQNHVDVRTTIIKGRCELVISFFDVHVPEHDRLLWAAALAFLADAQPHHIVLGGDFAELRSCSQHASGAGGMTYEADVQYVRKELEALRAAAPGARIWYLEGNHETRLTRYIESNNPQFEGALSLPESLGLADLGITWVPEDQQPIHFGTLDVLHGHQMGQFLPEHHAKKAALIYGRPGRQVMYGHTHKSQVFERQTYPEITTAYGIACMRLLRPKWKHGQEDGWRHEFPLAYVSPTERTAVFVVKAERGSFVVEGTLYTGTRDGAG